MQTKDLTLKNIKSLRKALLRPAPGCRYQMEGETVDLCLYPSAADLIANWVNCDIISNGIGTFKAADFSKCNMEGSFTFYGCNLSDCTIIPMEKGFASLGIIGGILKNCTILGDWQSVNFGPNLTSVVLFAETFWAHELILRIACAPMSGMLLDRQWVAKLLAGVMYDKEVIVPDKALVEGMQAILRQKLHAAE